MVRTGAGWTGPGGNCWCVACAAHSLSAIKDLPNYRLKLTPRNPYTPPGGGIPLYAGNGHWSGACGNPGNHCYAAYYDEVNAGGLLTPPPHPLYGIGWPSSDDDCLVFTGDVSLGPANTELFSVRFTLHDRLDFPVSGTHKMYYEHWWFGEFGEGGLGIYSAGQEAKWDFANLNVTLTNVTPGFQDWFVDVERYS